MLFEAEKNLVTYLKSSYETNLKSNETRKIINLYMETIDFDDKEEVKQYVSHPVNSFHLLHRHNRAKVIRDHPLYTLACSRGGGVSPLLTFAIARGVGVSGMPTSAIFDIITLIRRHIAIPTATLCR